MTYWEAILLGIVQGVFMFFPVSSTSHLVLLQHALIQRGSALPPPESPEMILFDLIVHVGTLVSIVVVFHKSLRGFLTRLWGDMTAYSVGVGGVRLSETLHLRLALLGLFTVLVTGVVGLTFKPIFEGVFAHPLAISGTLVITGLLLYFTDSVGPRPRGLRQVTLYVAIVIGLAQALALAPGFSRSGLTIALALFVGLKRRWAAEYSFFVAIPTILAATGLQAINVWRSGEPLNVGAGPLMIGFVVAAVVGIAALWLVLTLLYRARFRYFAYYVWILAAAVAVSSMSGTE